jgi:hypothetical protein
LTVADDASRDGRQLPPGRRLPLVERLDPAHPDYRAIIAAHETAMAAGEDGYVDPVSGFFVFTARSHWDRGTCCRSGCRHCPYEPGDRPAQPRPGTE